MGMIRDWALGPGSRIYAGPNEHLVLTYYTGKPVQSIAPVRREWLDGFDRDLVILESSNYDPLPANLVMEAAHRHGRTLAEAEVRPLAREALRLATILDLRAEGVSVDPPPRPPDPLDLELVALLRQSTRRAVQEFLRGTPLGRDQTLSTWQDFRFAFYYWFSDPSARKGPGLNYRTCRDTAHATVLLNGTTVLDCRRLRDTPLVRPTPERAAR
jgi:hypothetical protein